MQLEWAPLSATLAACSPAGRPLVSVFEAESSNTAGSPELKPYTLRSTVEALDGTELPELLDKFDHRISLYVAGRYRFSLIQMQEVGVHVIAPAAALEGHPLPNPIALRPLAEAAAAWAEGRTATPSGAARLAVTIDGTENEDVLAALKVPRFFANTLDLGALGSGSKVQGLAACAADMDQCTEA